MEAKEQTWAVRSHPSEQCTKTEIPRSIASVINQAASSNAFTCFNHPLASMPLKKLLTEDDFKSQAVTKKFRKISNNFEKV